MESLNNTKDNFDSDNQNYNSDTDINLDADINSDQNYNFYVKNISENIKVSLGLKKK
jgi:hypothetical protein